MNIKSNDPCPCGSGKKYKRCCKAASYSSNINSSQTHKQFIQRGIQFFKQKQLEDSIASFTQAIILKPEHADSHYMLAVVLADSGSMEKAIFHYNKAIEFNAEYFEAYNNLGNIYRTLGQQDNAEKYFKRALKLSPGNALVLNNLGNIKHPVCIEEAIDYFRQALKINPEYAEANSNLLIALNYLPEITREQLFKEHQDFARTHQLTITGTSCKIIDSSSPQKKLRVGYISPDFRQHPVAHFIEPVFSNYDQEKFETYVYYNNTIQDSWTKRLMALVDKWRNIGMLDDIQLASQIKRDKIDILLDLSGHTARNRLLVFPHRPAPVQASWLGYPHSTGLDSMDYYLTDKVADSKNDQQYYTEKLVFLEHGLSCHTPPDNAPEITQLPIQATGHITFGTLNILSKINDKVLDLWCRILHDNSNAKLLIFRNQLYGSVAEKLKNAFSYRGIDDSQLEFYSTMGTDKNYLYAYNKIDILLDTFPWSGHTTTCEALWMGVPVVTLYGDRHASRLSASVLHQINLSELIAFSEDEYVQIARSLASNMSRLFELRNSLREKMLSSPLCDGYSFTKSLEKTYRCLHENKSK